MIDLVIAPCSQLLTLSSAMHEPRRHVAMRELAVANDAALGINCKTGRIEYAGPHAGLDHVPLAGYCEFVSAEGCVVLPGFVDSHTHLVFAGDRADEFYRRSQGESYADIARAGGGIAKTVKATRAADEDELYALAWNRLRRLYANGTTTVEIKTGYGLDPATEIKCLNVIQRLRQSAPGLVVATYMGAHAVPPEFSERRAEYVEQVVQQLHALAGSSLAEFVDIFIDPLAFSHQEAELIVAAATASGLHLKLHADEFGDDGTAVWGAQRGAISMDHLGGVGPAGIASLAASGTIATLLPATMFFSGHGQYAPAREMIDAGCAVALASDLNPGSSLVYSMPLVMTLAVLEMQMSAEECLVASTINAAWSLRLESQVGSLEPGKRADVVIADIAHYSELPYHVGGDVIRDVFCAGRRIKAQGNLQL